MAKIELKTKILNDKYTEYVYEAFDIQNKEETIVSIPMNLAEAKTFDWNIGVILGGSGSGKTPIIKSLRDVKKVNFDSAKPLISNFDWLDPKDATFVLTSMGLSSVPTWLRPFHTLSNGEQYRAALAYLVASAKDGEVILVDEYDKPITDVLEVYIPPNQIPKFPTNQTTKYYLANNSVKKLTQNQQKSQCKNKFALAFLF
jgi:ABC-type phosphate/phosphonate transport system ATPase subunit